MAEFEIPNGLHIMSKALRGDVRSPDERRAISWFARVTADCLLGDLISGVGNQGPIRKRGFGSSFWRPGLPIAVLQVAVPDEKSGPAKGALEYNFSDVVFAPWRQQREITSDLRVYVERLRRSDMPPLARLAGHDATLLDAASTAIRRITGRQPQSMYDFANRVATVGNVLMAAGADIMGVQAPEFSANRITTGGR